MRDTANSIRNSSYEANMPFTDTPRRELAVTDCKILIVDDEPANVRLLEMVLEEGGYNNLESTTDPSKALSLFSQHSPDIVLLDLMMPGLNGYEVMAQMQPLIATDDFLPVVVLTADTTAASRRRALEAGVSDFLTKPFDAVELSLRLQHLLARRLLHRNMLYQNEVLEQKVQQRTLLLARSEHETAECLALAGEFRDDDTGQHTRRVGVTASLLASYLGQSNEYCELLLQAAALHDVGKIGIPDAILLKPGKLTSEEFDMIKTHCEKGHSILSRHHTPLLQLAATIALTHHERWDGRGYPNGTAGEEIPIAGRIVAIADVFDALTHERPYKAAWTIEDAVAEIQAQAGRQFDPRVTEAFAANLPEILRSQQLYLETPKAPL
jgi:putative two-component system response regulator